MNNVNEYCCWKGKGKDISDISSLDFLSIRLYAQKSQHFYKWLTELQRFLVSPNFEHFSNKWIIKFLRRPKGGNLHFQELKKLEIFERN